MVQTQLTRNKANAIFLCNVTTIMTLYSRDINSILVQYYKCSVQTNWMNGWEPLSVHQLGQWMPGRNQGHPAAHVYSLVYCPIDETPARISPEYSTAACSPAGAPELAEPGTVDCKHNNKIQQSPNRNRCNHWMNVSYKLKASDWNCWNK